MNIFQRDLQKRLSTYSMERVAIHVAWPGRYRGLSCCLYIKEPATLNGLLTRQHQHCEASGLLDTCPPTLPRPATIAITTALFISPEKLPPDHTSSIGKTGNRPIAITTLPVYWTAGIFSTMSTTYPTTARTEPAAVNGPRICLLSEKCDTTSMERQAAI